MRVWKTQQHTERAADAVRRIFYRIKLQGVEKSVKKAHNKDMLFFTIAHLSKSKKSEVEIEAVPVILTCDTLCIQEDLQCCLSTGNPLQQLLGRKIAASACLYTY